jgi:DNA-binding NtrC family response regulator
VVSLTATAPDDQQSFELDRPLREARDAFEKAYFEFHLAHEGGSMTRVAEKTGLERTHLYESSSNWALTCRAANATAESMQTASEGGFYSATISPLPAR